MNNVIRRLTLGAVLVALSSSFPLIAHAQTVALNNVSNVGVFPGLQPGALADLDHDGFLDIVVGGGVALPEFVHIAYGNGSGTFDVSFTLRAGVGLTGVGPVTVGDVNRDGNPDIVTANTNEDSISVMLGGGVRGLFRNGADHRGGGDSSARRAGGQRGVVFERHQRRALVQNREP